MANLRLIGSNNDLAEPFYATSADMSGDDSANWCSMSVAQGFSAHVGCQKERQIRVSVHKHEPKNSISDSYFVQCFGEGNASGVFRILLYVLIRDELDMRILQSWPVGQIFWYAHAK